MDFVEWCDIVLKKLIEASRNAQTSRGIGVDERFIASHLFDASITKQPGFHESTYHQAMLDALRRLQLQGLVEASPLWKVTRAGKAHAIDPILLWETICMESIENEYCEMLHAINTLGIREAFDHAWLEQVTREMLVAQLGWPDDTHLLIPIAQELEQWGYIAGRFYMGGHMSLSATYRGLAWETRRGFTLETKFIDGLVAEWETTSVDFKRELSTDTADQKAELIKDVLSLANTQASGRRWLIIGFDDKTRRYYGPSNPKLTQNHFEHLMHQYTSPMVNVRYEVVDYRDGPVGKLEVFREPKDLPYQVARSLGDRKRIEQGQIFVRHGSQVENPTDAELQAIVEENNRARSV